MTLHEIKEAVADIQYPDLDKPIDVGGGYSVTIHQDPHCSSPREWDNLTTMFTFHGRYTFGDKHHYRSDMFSGWEEFRKQIERDYDVVLIQPLYLYDHGQTALSTRSFIGRAQHASWDSGQIGWVFITRESLKNLMGWKRVTRQRKEKLREYLHNEVEGYDNWQRGECYGYQVEYQGEDVDSCFGYIGDDGLKYMLEEAAHHIDYHYHQRLTTRFERIKSFIKNHVPLQVRQQQLQTV